MSVELIGQQDNLFVRRKLSDDLLNENQKVLFLPGGMKPVMNKLSLANILGCHQASGSMPFIFVFYSANTTGLNRLFLGYSFQCLNACFFIHTDQCRAFLGIFDRCQDQLADQRHSDDKGLPILDLGMKPVFRFMRLELVSFLKSRSHNGARSD